MIKGVIYDLDGTIIDTVHTHEAAWQVAAKSIGRTLTAELLKKQKGLPNENAVHILFPDVPVNTRTELVKKKNEYILSNFGKFVETAEIKQTVQKLSEEGYQVWICTGAPKEFVLHVAIYSNTVEMLKDKTVWREMYTQGKPAAEPLVITLEKMALQPSEVLYIGDAWSDYEAAKAAHISFLYYCPEEKRLDLEIPENVSRIVNHKEIFQYLQ